MDERLLIIRMEEQPCLLFWIPMDGRKRNSYFCQEKKDQRSKIKARQRETRQSSMRLFFLGGPGTFYISKVF